MTRVGIERVGAGFGKPAWVLTLLFCPLLASCADQDGDGWSLADGDCDDGDPLVGPEMPDMCDGKDSDCDGAVDEDADGDGDGSPSGSLSPSGLCSAYWGDGLDCDDGDPVLNQADADGDGVSTCEGDCLDSNPSIRPGVPEVCDWTDHDCDGEHAPLDRSCIEECVEPLGTFAPCADDGCPSLAEWLAPCDKLEAALQQLFPGGPGCRAVACGDRALVLHPGLYGSAGLVFGQDCTVVAGYTSTDHAGLCFETSYEAWYGEYLDNCDFGVEVSMPDCL